MLVYGKNVALEILKKNENINKIYLLESFNDKNIEKYLKNIKLRVYRMSKNEMDQLVKENHQGIILDIPDYKFYSLNNITEKDNFIVMLDHLEDPHNFGAIIRTCECAGVDYIIIPNKRSVKINATVMKTSAGALANTKIIEVSNLNKTIDKLKDIGFWIIGTDADGQDYTKLDYSMKTCLVIGSEGRGLKYMTREKCDFIASLPLKGKINSLNASVAAGIMIYEVLKSK